LNFQETLTAAINDAAEHGFDSSARIDYWIERLRQAALEVMASPQETDQVIRQYLTTVYDRMIGNYGAIKYHPTLERFTIQRFAPAARDALNRRIYASADLIKLNKERRVAETLQRMRGWMTSVPAGGTSNIDRREVKTRIYAPIAQTKFEARRVAIDQSAKLTSAINDIIATGSNAIAARWVSHYLQPNYNFRHDHRDRDPRYKGEEWVYTIRGNWALEKGLMKVGPAGYTDQITQPAEEVYCLPGTAKIEVTNNVEVAYRRWYDGELAEVVTESGKTLRATPNHPVLTPDGLLPIGALNEGDYVIELPQKAIDAIASKLNNDQAVPTISNIFGSLHDVGDVMRVRGSRDQFHGDGLPNGDVDIVRAAWFLRDSEEPFCTQSVEEIAFTETSKKLSGGRPLESFIHRSNPATASFMGGLCEELMLLRRLSLGYQNIGGLYVPESAAGQPDQLSYSDRVHAESLAQRGRSLSALISGYKHSRLVRAKRCDFAGHVYNLQTDTGWYISDGAVFGNCRCYYIYIYVLTKLPRIMLTAKGLAMISQAGF